MKRRISAPSSRGQATVELLLLLALLFIILAYAVQTYSTHTRVVEQKEDFLDAERAAVHIGSEIDSLILLPIGTRARIFIPPFPGGETASIRVINGVVEVRASQNTIVYPLLMGDMNMESMESGNTYVFHRTPEGVERV
ncbi:MAG: hypothetical protein AABW68_04930 [archaeon]